MSKSRPIIFVILAVFAFLIGALFENVSLEQVTGTSTEDAFSTPTYSSGEYSLEYYDHAYQQAEEWEVLETKSAVSPHHLFVNWKIASLFDAIADEDARTVVLISPNHFFRGKASAQISFGTWDTPYGELESDREVVENLISQAPFVQNEESTFEGEHGIFNLTPFVKRSFPHAKLVAIVVKEEMSLDEAQTLGTTLARLIPDAVVIASVDFSHYLPETVALYHDAVTQRALATGACVGESCGLELEVDCNACLNVLFDVNKARGTQSWNFYDRDSSVSLLPNTPWRENTSHIYGAFTDGAPDTTPFAALHFVGDIMLDRGVRKRIDTADDVGYPWKEMSRYLSGSHLVIGNLEGTVNEQPSTYTYDPPFRFVFDPSFVKEMGKYIDVVSLANNHVSDVGSAGEIETRDWLDELGIPWFGSYRYPSPRYDFEIQGLAFTLIGYHAFQPAEDELVQEIKEAKIEGRLVIVMPHWGTEYREEPDSSQIRLAQLMVDAGADLVVGGHPHVPQDLEYVDGVPVVYSLGNFVFDQSMPETWTAQTIGAIFSESKIEIYSLPVFAKDGQPTPL
ncbi:MAG: AmmeMemoRadiSam system protein B [Patescibacteria group bacterium]